MILYTTAGCHLCEQAAAMLTLAKQDFIPTEIGDNDALVAEFGIRIPVLARNNATLDWPFNEVDLLQFISEHS